MEDDMFLDDDLDDIPDNTLLELEQNAISSTQKQKASQLPPPAVNLRKQAHNASSLYRSQKSAKNLAWRPPRRQQPGMPVVSQARPAGPAAPDPPSSDDYGFEEENVIDLDEPSMVIHPAAGPSAKPHSRPTSRTASRSIDPETAAAFAVADAEMGAGAQQWEHAPHLQHKPRDDSDTARLMARIAQLEAEQTRLQRLEQEARRAAATKQGEISIVRAKEEKAAKEYERRLSVMQKLHVDEAAKQKAELEAMRKQREKMETDNRFLQHDLAQEANRVKRTTGSSKARQTKEKDTPRKRKQGLGDGFNDSEVLMVSPSRSRERSKDQTPTAGAKRKRSAQDSPLPALSFMPPPKPSREVSGEQLVSPEIIVNVDRSSTDARERYDFVQRMLNHKMPKTGDRTIELFSKYSFPSSPARSLAAIFLDGITSPLRHPGTDYMPLKVSYTLLGLWSSCLHEKTYESLALILDMLRAALYFELSSQISKLVEVAVPICLQSIDLVVTPVIQSQHASFSATFDHKAQDDMATKVDVDEVVEFLHFINQSAALNSERLETFWKHIHFRGSLLMLNKVQPLPRIIQVLQILSTSILDTTFGAISSDSSQQEQQEQTTVDRLATWLFETPRAPKDENSYADEELAELRLETLNVFKKMCLTDHGGQLLARHRFAIAKLVKFLHGQVGKLYKIQPHTCRRRHSTSSEDEDQQPTLHDLTIATINTTVRVLHHILRTFDESIDLTGKLEVERGGYHAFLISMSRVAFSEQLVFEAGIETEVVEAAHDILDNVLSPEEGEAIVKAVETPRGTRSTTTRRDPSGESQDDPMQIDDDDEDDE
jgi:hypothetical protein